MRRLALALGGVFVLIAAAAGQAQSAYVAGTIGADIARLSRVESNVASRGVSTDSDVLSGSLRVGTAVGPAWGVELEFVRSGRSRSSESSASILPPIMAALPPNIPIPIGGFDTELRRSHTDYDGVAWVRQRAGGKIDLVYLGGVAFSRTRTELTQTFPTILRVFAPAGAFHTTTIDYSARPLVGAEARIGLTSHARLVPGVRLQALANGWLTRPYVGVGWFF